MFAEPKVQAPGLWRFEYKYRLPVQKVAQVRSAIRPFVKPDLYTQSTEHGRYLVRSLYYDADNYLYYQERIDGECDRVKLRIRAYEKALGPETKLRVEFKVRKGAIMEKHSVFVSADEYRNFLTHRRWQNVDDPVLEEFERYCWLKSLRPQLLVEYLREGYVTRSGEDIRITFDHHVASASSSSLFPRTPFFREHHRNIIVFEVKCRKNQPRWLLDLVKGQGLEIISNSKYCKGIEISKPDIVNPYWTC